MGTTAERRPATLAFGPEFPAGPFLVFFGVSPRGLYPQSLGGGIDAAKTAVPAFLRTRRRQTDSKMFAVGNGRILSFGGEPEAHTQFDAHECPP